MTCPADVSATLERLFTAIQHERMVDVPVLNPCLSVQAVGFGGWNEHCFGVLVTPWFMNLVLLSRQPDEWSGLASGTKIRHVFPSGSYEFIVAEEEGLGHYQMCSLFSPMFEFESQAAAVATAEAALAGILDEDNLTTVSTREREIRRIWRGESDAKQDRSGGVEESERMSRTTLKERIEKPMSRRDLLRGAFLRDEE